MVHPHDFLLTRTLYLPIIGTNAVTLYAVFADYGNKSTPLQFRNVVPANTVDLAKRLGFSLKKLEEARRLLEATGLLKSYQTAQGNRLLFTVLPPLSPARFFANKLLANLLQKRLGTLTTDSLSNALTPSQPCLDEWENVSACFQDLFVLDTSSKPATKVLCVPKKVHVTQEMPVPFVTSREEAIQNLSTTMFVKHLTGQYPAPWQVNKLTHWLEVGFKAPVLNLVFDYSDKVNNAVIFNFVNTIVQDLIDQNIMNFGGVRKRLNQAFQSRRGHSRNDATPPNSSNSATQKLLDDAFEELLSR